MGCGGLLIVAKVGALKDVEVWVGCLLRGVGFCGLLRFIGGVEDCWGCQGLLRVIEVSWWLCRLGGGD